jgi:uncharacterized membrane protein
MNAYGILKVVHVLSVIVWVGGAVMANLLIWRVSRAGDRAALTMLMGHMRNVGRSTTGPAAIFTLLSGVGMMIAGRLDHSALWIQLGFGGIVLHFLFGPFLLRRAGMELYAALTGGDEGRFAAARQRVDRLNTAYLALLAFVVGVMVLKPTL